MSSDWTELSDWNKISAWDMFRFRGFGLPRCGTFGATNVPSSFRGENTVQLQSCECDRLRDLTHLPLPLPFSKAARCGTDFGEKNKKRVARGKKARNFGLHADGPPPGPPSTRPPSLEPFFCVFFSFFGERRGGKRASERADCSFACLGGGGGGERRGGGERVSERASRCHPSVRSLVRSLGRGKRASELATLGF